MLSSQERGWNAIEMQRVVDCWAKDIVSINADATVLVSGKERDAAGQRSAVATTQLLGVRCWLGWCGLRWQLHQAFNNPYQAAPYLSCRF